jgi:hypothetical protein
MSTFLSWCSGDSCKKMSGIMNNLNTMLKSLTEKPISEDTLNERVNMEDTLYDLINQYIIDNGLEITYEGVEQLLVDLPIVKETIKRMYIMHYKEMGNERYKEVSSDINNLDKDKKDNSAYIMSIAEIMCDNEGPSFMFSYDREEINEQIAKCNISEPSKPRKPLPYSTVDEDNVRRYTTIAKGPMERGGKGKMHKTASKRNSKSKSNAKKSVRRATKRRLNTRKHGNKKNKRHVKKHTKRA